MYRLCSAAILGSALLLLAAAPAHANTGIPTLMVAWPLAWMLFPIVVVLEAVVGVRMLAIPFRQAVGITARANAWSTLVGLPAAWAKTLLVQIVVTLLLIPVILLRIAIPEAAAGFLNAVVGCAWLVTSSNHFPWELPAALMVLCIPFYFVSVRVEETVAMRQFDPSRANEVRFWMRRAHQLSYGVIAALLAAALILAYHCA